MTDSDAVLVTALAHGDALWLPLRRWGGRPGANRYTGLRRLHFKGTPYRVNTAGDEAGRKAGERELLDLSRRGLLTLLRDRTKWPHVKLTDRGEVRARALAGLPGRDVGRLILGAVAELTDREPRTMDRFWLPETALNGGVGWGLDAPAADRRGLAAVELDYLPAAAAGWLIAHSDIAGRAYYAVTAAGRREADDPTADPPPGRLPKFDPAALEEYKRARTAKLAAIESDDPAPPMEIGALPLVVAMRGVPFHPDLWWGFDATPDVGEDDDGPDGEGPAAGDNDLALESE